MSEFRINFDQNYWNAILFVFTRTTWKFSHREVSHTRHAFFISASFSLCLLSVPEKKRKLSRCIILVRETDARDTILLPYTRFELVDCRVRATYIILWNVNKLSPSETRDENAWLILMHSGELYTYVRTSPPCDQLSIDGEDVEG